MGTWRRYLDLWLAGALLCGLIVYQHGEETFAAVRPRLSEVKTFVTAKFAEFTAPSDVVPEETAAGVADGAAPIAGQEPNPLPQSPVISPAPGLDPIAETPLIRQTTQTFSSPFCPESFGHCCPR